MTFASLEYGHETNTSEQIVKVRRSFLAIFRPYGLQLHKSYVNVSFVQSEPKRAQKWQK
jgi:hypothetical protein